MGRTGAGAKEQGGSRATLQTQEVPGAPIVRTGHFCPVPYVVYRRLVAVMLVIVALVLVMHVGMVLMLVALVLFVLVTRLIAVVLVVVALVLLMLVSVVFVSVAFVLFVPHESLLTGPVCRAICKCMKRS